ncbi:MAG: enoyl-CoA hydratase [Bacteroidota bacterium]
MATLTSDLIHVHLENGIKTITINQPKKKNALSFDMSATLRDIILESKDDDSQVLVLTGAGDNFCSGADLDPRAVNDPNFNVTEFLETVYNPTILGMRQMNKPIIAKVRGVCVGIGINFALACDLVYAEENAVFSEAFVKIGLSSDGGGSFFMARHMGYHKAYELMVTGEAFDGKTAAGWGLINKAVPAGELDALVDGMAHKLANGPSVCIRQTKANLRAAMEGGLADALQQEAISQGINFVTHDFKEGVTAFLEKRKPVFKGK